MRNLLIVTALGLAVAVAGCSGGDGISSTTSTSSVAATAMPSVATATPSMPTLPATISAAPTPAPTAQLDPVRVLDYKPFPFGGSTVFVGELINTGLVAVTDPVVTVTLKDGAGGVIGVGSEPVLGPSLVKPGQKAPFMIDVSNAPGSWAKEELAVKATAYRAGSSFLINGYTDLKLSGVTVQGENGGVMVRGEVIDTGTKPVNSVSVTFVARDADGAVAWVNWEYAKGMPLQPGGSAPFQIGNREISEVPPLYDILVAGFGNP